MENDKPNPSIRDTVVSEIMSSLRMYISGDYSLQIHRDIDDILSKHYPDISDNELQALIRPYECVVSADKGEGAFSKADARAFIRLLKNTDCDWDALQGIVKKTTRNFSYRRCRVIDEQLEKLNNDLRALQRIKSECGHPDASMDRTIEIITDKVTALENQRALLPKTAVRRSKGNV